MKRRKHKQEHQEINPSNSRIFINYRKGDNPDVRMEYINVHKPFVICLSTFIYAWFFKGLIIPFGFLALVIIALRGMQVTFIGGLLNALIFINLTLVPPILFAMLFAFNNNLLKLMPEINRYLTSGRHYEAEFEVYDIEDGKIELPLFANIVCDYKVTQGMSKYLSRFEIVEHPFNHQITSKRRVRNEYLWKAVWYFDKVPSTGTLKVKFK